jgi:hypothetical protein
VGLRADDLASALRGLAAFAATRLAAAFFATFAHFLDVLPANVFTPGRPDLNGGACLAILAGCLRSCLQPLPPLMERFREIRSLILS